MKKSTCTLLSLALLGFTATTLKAQIAINNSAANPDPSAILDLNTGNGGVNKGFLPPQVALNATNVAAPVTTPATGLIVYNTATAGTAPNNVIPGYYYWNGTQWLYMIALLPGNAGQVLTSNGGGAPSWATIAPVQTNVKDSAWLLTGNYGTTVGTNYIGTNDNNDLEFRINNKFSGLIDSSLNNTFLGFTSGMDNSTGTQNTAMGYQALALNTVGWGNTATGGVAMHSNTTGYYNTAVGYYALVGNTYGSYNVAIGSSALYNNTGSYNTALGFNAGTGMNPVTNATSIGFNSIANYSNSVVLGNTSVSQTQFNGALMPNYSGNYQAGVTGQVLTSQGAGIAPQWETPISVQTNVKDSAWLLTGNAGTNRNKNFIGTVDNDDLEFRINNKFSGLIDDSIYNTYLGYEAGQRSMHYGGGYNVGIGYQALYSDSTRGEGNVALGVYALYYNTIGQDNTALGFWALQNNTIGDANVAIGQGALGDNITGSWNVANGLLALASNTIGGDNTAIGSGALESNTSGYENTAIGEGAMDYNTTGYENTVTGSVALNGNTTGHNNTVTGYSALVDNTTGSNNTATGSNAAVFNTTGSNNVAEGMWALIYNTTGSYNTAIGFQALYTNLTGSYNTALGYDANVSSGSITNATAIGYGATVSSNNTVVMGNDSVTAFIFNGDLEPGVGNSGTSGQVLTSQGTGVAPQWVTPSSDSTITYATGAQAFVNNPDPFSTATAGYSCTTSLANVGASITLSTSGTYLIMASADCGAYSTASFSYVGIALTDGTNYWGSNLVDNVNPHGSTFNWAPWSTTTVVTVSTSTTYNIQAEAATSGDGYVRNARVTAIKLQ